MQTTLPNTDNRNWTRPELEKLGTMKDVAQRSGNRSQGGPSSNHS